MPSTDPTPTTASPDEVLVGMAGARDQLRRIEQAQVALAVEWAKHNPSPGPGPITDDAGPAPRRFDVSGRVWRAVAAMGCVHFDEFALPEFAVAAGLSEYTAAKLMRESLMLVHLLPRVWHRVLRDGLDVWRARALAADCWGLPADAIDFIDAQMSQAGARITDRSREKILAEARARFEPAEQAAEQSQALAARGIEVDFARAEHGVVPVYGALDMGDAQALEAALITGAQALGDLGSTASREVRRAWALGDLARSASGQGTLDHGSEREPGAARSAPWVAAGAAGEAPDVGGRPHWNGKGASPPQVKLFIHINAPPGPTPGTGPPAPGPWPEHWPDRAPPATVTVAGSYIGAPELLNAEQVKDWLTRPTGAGAFHPVISIREALNFHEFPDTPSYTPTERVRDHVQLSQSTCIFPFCLAQAWRCDADHNEPWREDGAGGATCACNLANLCRRHHRLKTHADEMARAGASVSGGTHATWRYADLGGGEYYWRGPRGLGFIRTPSGTYEAAGQGATGAPPHPGAVPPATAAVRASNAAHPVRADVTIDRLLAAAAEVEPRDYEPDWASLTRIEFPPGERLPTNRAEAEAFNARQARRRSRGSGRADPHRLGGAPAQLDRGPPGQRHPDGLRERRSLTEP